MTVQRSLVAGALMIIVAGCGMFDDEGGLELRTDKASYQPGDEITITARNRSDNVVYFSTCMPTWLEELADDDKVAARVGLGPVCECICTTPLKPGASWTHDVDVSWLWQNLGATQPKIGPDYRFALAFFRDEEMKRSVRPDQQLTNEFTFVLPVQP